MTPKLITADDLANRLNISRSQVYALTRRARQPLPCLRVGDRLLRFDEASVNDWLTATQCQPATSS